MRSKLFIGLLFVLILAAGIVIGGRWLPERNQSTSDDQRPIYTEASLQNTDRFVSQKSLNSSRETAITRAVEQASPAVVGVSVVEIVKYNDPFSQFFDNDPFFRQFFQQQQQVQSAGSGFLISSDGYIVTNDHVAGNAKEITVTLTNGKKYTAALIGHDVKSDLALLKIDGSSFPKLILGNSDDIMIGEWVIAFGNPFGMFEVNDKPYITVGVVSALKMDLQSADPRRSYKSMIGTDASINSGNSGGPLLNSAGEVIGVNTLIFTPNQGSIGLGFAIPINRVKEVINQLQKHGKVERGGFSGLEVQKVDPQIARYFGLSRADGVVVTNVVAGSQADKAGLKVGDVILEVNGSKVNSDLDFWNSLGGISKGGSLILSLTRDQKNLVIKTRVG